MLIFWSILFSIKFGKTVSDLNSKQCHILIRQNSTYIFMQEKHASKWSFNSEYQCTVSIAGLGIRINFLLFRVQLFFSIRIQLHTTNTLWRVCSDLNFNKFTIINNFNAFSVFLILFFSPGPTSRRKIEFGSGSTAQNSTGSLYFTKLMFPSNLN